MIDTSITEGVAIAVHTRLTASLMVKNRLGDPARIYDAVPEDPVFPYLTYGDMRAEDQSGDRLSVTCHSLTLHIWSRYAGRAETFAIISAVTSALEETPLSLGSGADLFVAIPYVDVMRAPGGRTLHGLIRLKVYHRILAASS